MLTKNLFGSETMNSFFEQYFSSLDVLLKYTTVFRVNMTVLVCFIGEIVIDQISQTEVVQYCL